MGTAEKSAIKRLGRNAIGLVISGTVAYLTGKPYLIVLAPAINALGKWLRSKFNIPFVPV